jgi:hypothetical protein
MRSLATASIPCRRCRCPRDSNRKWLLPGKRSSARSNTETSQRMGEADSNEAAAAWSSKTNATLENQSEPSGVQAGKTLFGDRRNFP